MKRLFIIVTLAIITAFALNSCGFQKNMVANQSSVLNSVTITRIPTQIFQDLYYGVESHVVSTSTQSDITGYTHHLSGKSFFASPTISYIHSMGLKNISSSTDYHLYITIIRADVDGYNGNSWVDLNVILKDSRGKEVFSQNVSATSKNAWNIAKALDESYTQCLEQIDWNRIASYLKVEQLAKNEPNKMVQGLGDTALEQTIIRWDVQSRPQGADIYWRVVSTTPEVKSTNNKYIMTTPYEATKALGIKGLTYQTAGNVRVILRCELDGYKPQEKEFDIRMVLDQEEISTFFKLVKEE